MNPSATVEITERVRAAFAKAKIAISGATVRRFPGETIVVVEVHPADFQNALSTASELDEIVPEGFITVRKASISEKKATYSRAKSILDNRVNDLIELLNARSRTSEQQPSLRYIRDASQTVTIAMSRRHHLIFGRRGVGKTALMLEAKRLLEGRGAITFWINIQAMRSLTATEAFLTTASRLCDIPDSVHLGRATNQKA